LHTFLAERYQKFQWVEIAICVLIEIIGFAFLLDVSNPESLLNVFQGVFLIGVSSGMLFAFGLSSVYIKKIKTIKESD